MKRSIFEILKISVDSDRIHNSVWRLIVNYNIDKSVLDAEAEKLALVMTGQYTWEGIKPEYVSYTGLARKANAYLKKQAKTTFRIKETIVYGNGTSYYTLK